MISDNPPMIACMNSSEDVVLLLRDIMLSEGWRAVTHVTPVRYGAGPAVEFVRQLRPDVAIYTISVPYREGWEEFEALRTAMPGCPFVLTTTNRQALNEIVGPNEAIEIIGKPFDIDEVIAAVRQALEARRHG